MKNMKNYLSMGFGVNSVAMYFMLKDQGINFEAVFVDHGCDWPETYAYAKKFMDKYPVTVLQPTITTKDGVTFNNLFEYCMYKGVLPSVSRKWCTTSFKVRVCMRHYEKPCFQFVGIDAGESGRASLSITKGVENRYPLIEEEVDRNGCKKIIIDHGEDLPMKSGCWFCPYQSQGQIRQLRRTHPDLFCNIVKMEKRKADRAKSEGKEPFHLMGKNRPIQTFINEDQIVLPGLKQEEYPPCQCGL